jgi:hypothetical protein
MPDDNIYGVREERQRSQTANATLHRHLAGMVGPIEAGWTAGNGSAAASHGPCHVLHQTVALVHTEYGEAGRDGCRHR